jgi:hypothetical protein
MKPKRYFGAGVGVFEIDDWFAKASASCCGVNLALARWGWSGPAVGVELESARRYARLFG